MRIVVGSAFRDSAGAQVTRWLDQVLALKERVAPMGWEVRGIAVEGDSVDATVYQLTWGSKCRNIDVTTVSRRFGNPRYGSTEDPARMAALSEIGNYILDHVEHDDDVLLYVESDLIWTADTALDLILNSMRFGSSIIAPMIFAGEHFYDVWAYRKDGARFAPFYPYHSGIESCFTGSVNNFAQLDSAGSCLAIPGHIARSRDVRMTSGALVEWCERAREAGHRILLDTTLRVEHPA